MESKEVYERVLFEEEDYFQFQTKAKHPLNDENRAKWELFCQHLNAFNEDRSLKFLLMEVVFHCLGQAASDLELAQFLSLAKHVKAGYGVGILQKLLEAPVKIPKLSDYLQVLQLLHDLVGEAAISGLFKTHLPNLSEVISELRVLQTKRLESLYPKREIGELLERFARVDELTQFPLKKAELDSFKEPYLRIINLQKEFQLTTESTLKKIFLEQGMHFRASPNTESKAILIAIMIETIRRKYKILPYDTQIITFLALINKPKELKGRIAQVKTGEGKSTLFCMLVAFIAVQGHFVDLVTSSSYLAIRDYEKYAPFLNALGLSSSHISYPKPEKEHFHGQILYGTNTDFEFALLRDGLNTEKLRFSYSLTSNQLVPRTQDRVVIDEVDNMLLDNEGAARIAKPGVYSCSWIYKPILEFVKHSPDKKVADLRRFLNKEITGTQLQELARIPDIKLGRWLNSAKIALYEKIEKRDYKVKDNTIVIVDYDNTGEAAEGSQWPHGVHQFVQAKHDLKITAESLTVASIAHPTYFGSYQEIYGLTGTMGELCEREEIQEIYRVDSFDVPSHIPSQRQCLPVQMVADESAQQKVLIQLLQKTIKANRPSLVIVKSIAESERFDKHLTSSRMSHQLLDGEQRESDAYVVARAGEPKTVTVGTNKATRGTDIILAELSKSAGGLSQVFTYLPKNVRVEGQGVGRAGRQGQKGSCTMILREDDDYIVSLLNEAPMARLVWASVTTSEEKLAILKTLRSLQVQSDSARRRYHSQLETLLFSYLNQFFYKLQNIQDLLKEQKINDELLTVCQDKVSPTDCALLSLKDKSWLRLMQNATVLIMNQQKDKRVDWQPFLSQFKAVMLELLQNYWANFYSKISDEVYGMPLEMAQRHLEKQFTKLQLSTHFSQESVVNCLKGILYKAIQDKDIVPEMDDANQFCFFKVPPNKLTYLQALEQAVGKKEVRVERSENAIFTAYLSLNWLKQSTPAMREELANGGFDPEQEGSNRTGIGISKKFLERVRVS